MLHTRSLSCCRLDSNFTVRVCDGALSQEFYPECYHQVYGAVRPVRWAAIETLQEGLCTVQSNVVRVGDGGVESKRKGEREEEKERGRGETLGGKGGKDGGGEGGGEGARKGRREWGREE